jgi:hypothetical protein
MIETKTEASLNATPSLEADITTTAALLVTTTAIIVLKILLI